MGFDPAFIASGAGHRGGSVPDPGSTTGIAHFLREDGIWSVPGYATEAALIAEVDPSINTWTVLLTLTPAAGTYIVWGQAMCAQSSGIGDVALRLRQALTVKAGAQGFTPSTGALSMATPPRLLTLNGTDVLTLETYCTVAGVLFLTATPVQSAGPVTTLVAKLVTLP